MIKNIGIDIVETARIDLNNALLLARFLAPEELTFLTSLPDARRQQTFAAGRWAVKEAILKVLNPDEQVGLAQINIGYDALHRPVILAPQWAGLHISLAHEQDYAVGMAVREND